MPTDHPPYDAASAVPTGAALVSEQDIAAFQRDGCACLRGLFRDWVENIAAGMERNLAEPGPFAFLNHAAGGSGRFFEDYCNWDRIPEYRAVVLRSPAAEAAARVMRSPVAQFFHEHVLIKEPGTSKETPWHQDAPFYFTRGTQTVSFWVPIDPVGEASLRLIAGSHEWDKLVRPTHFTDNSDFYDTPGDYLPIPDPDAEPDRYRVLQWEMEPGDAVIFDFRTVHGARANMLSRRRRAFSMRWVGEDVRYQPAPGRTSPPFPGHAMQAGQRLREDWFPVVWRS